MKTVQCPICHQHIFSETFWNKEKFPCPHCSQVIEIREENGQPIADLPDGYMEQMSWAQGIWKDGRLFLTPQKLAIIGELVVEAMGMEKWSQETPEQIADRRERMHQAREALRKQGIDNSVLDLSLTLLDLFVNLKMRNPE